METAVNTSAITAGANIGTGDKTPNRAGTASSYRLTSRDVELAFKFFSSAAAATGATAAADGGRTVSKQDIHKYVWHTGHIIFITIYPVINYQESWMDCLVIYHRKNIAYCLEPKPSCRSVNDRNPQVLNERRVLVPIWLAWSRSNGFLASRSIIKVK